MIIVATDMSAVVRYFTRFTEEAFAALIGIIFVYEALKKLFSKFNMMDQITHLNDECNFFLNG